MDVQHKVELLFQSLETSLCWYSDVEGFAFKRRDTGWAWWCENPKFSNIIDGQVDKIQLTHFKTRKDAAQYIDALFGTNVVQNSFRVKNIKKYNHKQERFSLIKRKDGWVLWIWHHGMVKTDGNLVLFKSRRSALEYFVKLKSSAKEQSFQ